MEYLVNGEQSRMIDRFSIDEIGIPSLVLMERASLSVADEVQKLIDQSAAGDFPGKRKKLRVVSVCGSGNNGGDGMAAARILFGRGCEADILLAGNPDKLSDDAARQLSIARRMGVKIIDGGSIAGGSGVSDQEAMTAFLKNYDIMIDAVFGTGLSRDVGGRYRDWILAVNAAADAGASVYSVDIASGISSDDGRVLGVAVRADVSVTFGYRKLGAVLYPGSMYSGRTVCSDIGFDRRAVKKFTDVHIAYGPEDLGRLPERRQDSNKGTYGRTLIIAGSRNMAGAAAFSSRAAYYTGTGLVTVYTPECNRCILQQLMPEAVMKTYPEDADDSETLLRLLQSHTAAVLGPGIGISAASERIVETVLAKAECPLIIDADALNIISEHREWLKASPARMVLTPHLKELSRLTGYNIQTLRSNLQKICVDFSREYGVICIAKDARTMIFGTAGNIYVNLSGNNGMSTGGSGDVLTGIIAGLCAQGLEPEEASRLGVYIHGLAGERASDKRGTYSVTASDITEAVPDIIAEKNK